MRAIAIAAAALAAATAAPAIAGDFGVKTKFDHHGGMHRSDIVDTAIAADDFNTLVTAVQAAGLVDTLKGDGPFTVFAPTDAAFAALPQAEIARLLQPANRDELASILTYHVVPGRVLSTDLAGQQLEVETVQGDTVMIDATDGVMVDGASVIQADIEASNGVIHVIDGVILPH